MLEKITPLILTYNEAPNIERTLQKLTWANRIVVVDSYSTDGTLEVLYSTSQVEIFQRQFESFASQCNYGLSEITSEWVLSIDADYLLTDDLIDEIQALPVEPDVNSYSIRFKYCIFGKPLRGTLLPPRRALYRREKAIYKDDGHAHRVYVEGKSVMLSSYIHHDDCKSLNRWLWTQDRYMMGEVKKLLESPAIELAWSDRIRRTKILAPFLILIYCLILKGAIFDGWRGWYYTLQRVLAEILLAIHLIEIEKFEKADAKPMLLDKAKV